jgi:hypothetical protein
MVKYSRATETGQLQTEKSQPTKINEAIADIKTSSETETMKSRSRDIKRK